MSDAPKKPAERDDERQLREVNDALLVSSARQHELTEQAQRAEAALRETEEQFRRAIEGAPIPIIMHAEDGEVLQISEAWTDLTGYTIEDKSVIQTWLTKAYGYGGNDLRGAVHALFHSGEAMHSVEFDIVTRAGERRVWSFSASSPGTLHDGRRFIVGMADDITDRRRSEDALRKSEDRFRQLVSQVKDYAIFSTDLEGRAVTWNEGVERVLGFTESEFIGQDITETIFTPEDFAAGIAQRELDDAARYGVAPDDRWMRRKNGERFFAQGVTSAIKDEHERVTGFSKIMRDQTEVKEAQENLRESEERFRTLADNSPVLIWVNGLEGCEFVNHAYREFLGVDAAAVRNFEWARYIHAEDRDEYVNAYLAAFARRETFTAQFRFRRADGEYRWMRSVGSPHVTAAGEFLGYIGSTFDITDIYESQQALKELARRKDEFLANMSHEIRSPLTGIMGYADLLLGKLEGAEEIECVRTIKDSGNYLMEIINDILDLSKIEAGKLVLNIEAVSVHEVFAEIQGLMDLRARQKNLTLSLRYDSLLPARIQTDRTRLRQIMINLVGNAIKFTEKGRVEIVARSVEDGRMLQVEVIDTGIGIAREHQEIVFNPFTQADSTSTREYGGTGLGLTITKRLVEMLGGTIWFESEPGKGSTFRVSVPVGAVVLESPIKRRLPQLNEVQPSEGALANRRVLVVDDREEICYLVSRYIIEAGGQTDEATDGEQALAKVAAAAGSDPFDAIVLDIHMPRMDGYQVAQSLRGQGYSVPIIALTAGAMAADREKCLAAGFDDYLTKPIDRQKLVYLVAHHALGRDAGRNGAGGNLRVLLVDDSHNACDFLTRFLEKRGYEVRAVHDGASAVAIAPEFRPDVFLLDIRLPDMSGYELMKRLKDLDGIAEAKFIGLSGYHDSDDSSTAAFDHFLEKPLDTSRLETILASMT